MSAISFSRFVDSEGLSFGLAPELIEQIGRRTEAGEECGLLLDDPALAQAGIGPTHLLQIRRAHGRHRALGDVVRGAPGPGPFFDRVGPQAARFAGRFAKSEEERVVLVAAFASAVSATQKRGRLRVHQRRPGEPLPDELSAFSEHTESCDEIPPHRWFAISRGVADGLLWVEVIPPAGEVDRSLGPLGSRPLAEELTRALAKAVLDKIGERSEEEVLTTVADALYALLSRPPIAGPVAGVAADARRFWVHVSGGDHDGEALDLRLAEAGRLAAWIKDLGVLHVGVAGIGGRRALPEVVKALSARGLSVEMVREAGLMKQARSLGRPIKAAAAEIVARRLKDPLSGYAELDADELGLGEYLDRVDPERLRAALEDVRAVASWERRQGKTAAPIARGVALNPIVKGIDDLRPGMEMVGVVANLTHFGAFVELGLAAQGLIHLSELSDRFIKHPSEVVQVGDRVRVRVIELDAQKKRISLSMRIDRGTRGKEPRSKRVDALKSLDSLFKK